MKKLLLSLPTALVFLYYTNTYAQIGINTSAPASTLDIKAKNETGTSTDTDGILIPRIDRQRAQSMTSVSTSTLVFINNITTGTPTGTALNIDSTGYYYYNGTVWVKLHNPTNTPASNIYNSDGSLTGNRTVTQGSNTLTFTGTSTNAFSISGKTFSVDAANQRVGMGTTSPSALLSLRTNAGSTTDAFSVGIDNCGGACGQGIARNITLFNANSTGGQFAGIEFIPSTSATGISGASINGIDRDGTNNFAGLQFFTRNATDFGPRMTIRSSGNIGIGTTNPGAKLHLISSEQSNAFQMQDGSEGNGKVLVSDGQGKATWRTSSAIISAVLGKVNTTSKTVNNNTAIGSSVSLTPGRWLVYIGQLINTSQAASSTNNLWMRITLSDSSSSISTSTFTYLASQLVSGWLSPSISNTGGFSFLSGIIPVQVNSNTTLFTWFGTNSPAGTPPAANVATNAENYFFAIPMN
ncbi:hypothetical protein [Chryseobacterium sp.]|uniref:hypothetical protein n=1 Tax=Chryseobacterium sp. TaxID=1871047 RepID=UPI0033425864